MARTTRRRTPPAPNGNSGAAAEPRRVRENLPRPAAPPVAAGITRTAPAQKKRHPLAFLSRLQPRYVAEVVAETKKVTWPTMAETRYLTIVVAIVATAVGIFLGGVDFIFGWIIEKMFF